ncbi:MAG: hypothetical protein M1820_005328 [Bogoriella megaspora]|nr:MAG: hypothetical protein M1820_005328 [Bogoriella megaspora]
MTSIELSTVAVTSRDTETQHHQETVLTSNEEEPSRPNARPAIFRSTAQEVLFIFTATMSVAMPSFLQGSSLVVSSYIKKDLNMTTSQLTWMTASSALTSGSFLLFFGKVADMFGRRGILLISLFLFSIFNLATGFSKDALTLDVLNGIMGWITALAIPAAQGTLGSIYDRPSKRKNYAFACFSAGNHLGFVFSSILSGVATQFFGWRASFWLLAVIYLAVAGIACFTVPPDDSEKLPLSLESLKQFDVVGAALTVAGIGLFTAGISIGPNAPEGWKTPYVLVFITLGLPLVATFIWWEGHFPHPLMPMKIWRKKEFALVIAGKILHRVSNKLLMGLGAFAFTVAFLLVAVQRSGVSYWALTFPALAIVVVGTDFEFNVVNMYVLSSLPKSQQSIASSVFQTTIKLAVTIGLSVCAAIFSSVSDNPATSGFYAHDPFEPYAALFWFATAMSFISLLLVPFLKIKTQGHED